MTTALYRRYRPEAFGEMIGQSQVTDPLMTALRNDRVGHAYLFSGPRGCGKTTSARILARCLNCAQGPTDTPCGTCPSCVELSRAGGGSLDVVEIDAASHNGVDDARELRERAIFAPARDRFKIFILDEAHMVTQQGFNALLKLVEEPPEHVKFIFATTEPEKVLGTIRSRTHHYPFRLVPPGPMLEYLGELCRAEGVEVEAGVLPLVVRAGGGSPRDTLSVLDQLIAGSEVAEGAGTVVSYARAVALLGYTHAELLDEIVDAFADGDAQAAFVAVDRVVQTGQDPRRFVDDLLERLRDLIIIDATAADASAVLRGVPTDQLERMGRQAHRFGGDRLSRTADQVSRALDDMTGATSPRLHLELMIARVFATIGAARPAAARDVAAAPAAAAHVPAAQVSAPPAPAAPEPVAADPAPSREPAPAEPRVDAAPPAEPAESKAAPEAGPGPAAAPEPAAEPEAAAAPVTAERLRDAWPEVLAHVEGSSRTAWLVASAARVIAFDDEVLTLGFQSRNDLTSFKPRPAGSGASDDLREAILATLGVRVKFLARVDEPLPERPGADAAPSAGSHGPAAGPAAAGDGGRESAPLASRRPSPAPQGSTNGSGEGASTTPSAPPAPSASGAVTDWAVAAIPTSDPTPPADTASPAPASSVAAPAAGPSTTALAESLQPGLPVDDDPADAARAAARAGSASTLTAPPRTDAPRDGETAPSPAGPYADVPPDDEPPYDDAPYDDGQYGDGGYRDGGYGTPSVPEAWAEASAPPENTSATPIAAPSAPAAPAPAPAQATPEPEAAAARPGVDRYGEAVVRQVLGARFVREEPYEPPTRFR